MEELIRIRLRGPGSSSPVPILVDASRKISSQIEMFLRKLGLQIDSGDPAYDVHHAESRKILDSSRSFREAGVRENHVLVLLPRVAPPPPPPEPPPEACDHGLRPPRPPRKPEAIVAFETAVREVREGRRSLFELDAPLAAAAAVAADADHITRLFETIGRMKLLSGIPWAAEQLRNGSSKVREGAVRLLSRLQAEDRAGEIRPLLSDPSGEVRGQAALAMSRFDAEEAAPAVLALLEDPEPLARAGAAQALERIPVKGREDRYLKLLQDSEPVVREAAVDGLAEVAPAALRERLDRLLQDPLQEVRAAACRAARNLKHSAAIPSLLTLLRKEGPDADNAMRALADLGAKEVSDLLRLKLDGPSEWDQVNAVEMLTRLGTVERRDLLPFAAHKDEMLRQAAVKGFVRLGAREDIVPFLSDADPKVQVEACAALGGPAEIQRLRSFLSDRSPEVRSAAAKALAGLKVRDAAPELTPLLLDAEPGVRMNAVHALTELEYLPAVPSIAPMLGDEDIRVRLFSGVALRVLGSPALGPDLLPLLSAPHSRVRLSALRLLQELDIREAAGAMERLLRDPNPMVRSNAAARLALLGAESSIPALRGLRADPSRQVRFSAAAALASFGDPGELRAALDPEREPDSINFTLLNGTREPQLWKGLRDTKIAADLVDAPLKTFAAVAEQAGLRAELSAELRARPEPPADEFDPIPQRSGATLLTAITLTLVDHDLILDPGRMRIVPTREAAAEWVAWIGRL